LIILLAAARHTEQPRDGASAVSRLTATIF
jgi:hypothetical protein